MAKIILITGGARSGKSRYAQEQAEALEGSRAYLATCPSPSGDDSEMLARVDSHKEERVGKGWQTIEEEVDLKKIMIANQDVRVFLVDCLTLWISNILYAFPEISEEEIGIRCRELVSTCREREGTVFLVTNEVGSGIVPENSLARKFRDLSGRCNQELGRLADQVVLVACGLPLFLKKG